MVQVKNNIASQPFTKILPGTRMIPHISLYTFVHFVYFLKPSCEPNINSKGIQSIPNWSVNHTSWDFSLIALMMLKYNMLTAFSQFMEDTELKK